MPKSSAICVDANLVLRFVARQEDEVITNLWHRWRIEERSFVAPMLLRYEVTNALHRLRRAGTLTDAGAHEALRSAIDLPIKLHADAELHDGALGFAARFDLPAAYDAHYLALADQLGVEFWTADRRLAHTVGPHLSWVRLAG